LKPIAIVTLTILAGTLAYLAAIAPQPTEWQIDHGQKVAPNAYYRVRVPCVPVCDEQSLERIVKESDETGLKLVAVIK
jgi:hypothetical protein